MYGVTTRDPDALDGHEAGPAFYTVKRVSGTVVEPREDAVNTIACFGDAATAASDPDTLTVTASGIQASAARPEFVWDWLCPTNPEYRDALLSVVADCVEASPDVRLNTAGFAREQCCHCDRCDHLFETSDHDDRMAWRTATITSFIERVRDRVPGDLYLTVHPDPYPGQLARRRGLDLATLDDIVDAFVVPLCATTYETTYWLEIIARGFDAAVDAPLVVQLSATDDPDDADAAVAAVTPYADEVVFGGDAEALAPVLSREATPSPEGPPSR